MEQMKVETPLPIADAEGLSEGERVEARRRVIAAVAPANWTPASYKKHNDDLAKKYGEPFVNHFAHAIGEARRHLRNFEKRRDESSKCSDLHAAVEALLRAVEKGRAR